jgi:hypothetical protein
LANLAKKPLTALIQEAEVGVYWKTKRGVALEQNDEWLLEYRCMQIEGWLN